MPRTYPVVGRVDTLILRSGHTPNKYSTQLRPIVPSTMKQRSVRIVPTNIKRRPESSLIRIKAYKTAL